MFIMQAPYPAVYTTIALPSPTWSDWEALTSGTQILRSMGGSKFTYNKSRNDRKRYQWSFKITADKAWELGEFLQLYLSTPLQIIDHKGGRVQGYLTVNPFELSGESKAGGLPGGELVSITLDFEELE